MKSVPEQANGWREGSLNLCAHAESARQTQKPTRKLATFGGVKFSGDPFQFRVHRVFSFHNRAHLSTGGRTKAVQPKKFFCTIFCAVLTLFLAGCAGYRFQDAFTEEQFVPFTKKGSSSVTGRVFPTETVYLSPLTRYTREARAHTVEIDRRDLRLKKYVHVTVANTNGDFEFHDLPGGDYVVERCCPADGVNLLRRAIDWTPGEWFSREFKLNDSESLQVDVGPPHRPLSPVVVSAVSAGPWAVDGHSIVGWVTNISSSPLERVRVEFNLLDASGARVGTAYDSIHYLAPGTWKFRARIYSQEAVQVQPARLIAE